MTQRAVGVTDVASGSGVADYRTRERSVSSATVCEQYLIPIRQRVPSFVGMASDFWAGNAASELVKVAMSNLAGSTVLVAVTSCLIHVNAYSTANTLPMWMRLYKQSATATNGATTLAKVSAGTGADASESSNASVVLRSRHDGDTGTNATTVTLTLGSPIRTIPNAFLRTTTTTGAQAVATEGDTGDLSAEYELIGADAPIILRAGESIALTSFGNSSNYVMMQANFVWEEYTLP